MHTVVEPCGPHRGFVADVISFLFTPKVSKHCSSSRPNVHSYISTSAFTAPTNHNNTRPAKDTLTTSSMTLPALPSVYFCAVKMCWLSVVSLYTLCSAKPIYNSSWSSSYLCLCFFLISVCHQAWTQRTTSAPAALRQARTTHTHTLSEGSAEVHALYNLQEVIKGCEIKGFVWRENIPPLVPPWSYKDWRLPH